MADLQRIEAPITSWYARRMLFLGAICLGLSGWFAYDGFFGYPKKNETYEAFKKIYDEADPKWTDQWNAYSRGRGIEGASAWREKHLDKLKHSANPEEGDPGPFYGEDKLREQKVFSLGTLVAALAVLVVWLLNRKKSMAVDDESFYPPKGGPVAFADIQRVDKRKWESQGLAFLTHGGGRTRVDGLKYGGFKNADPPLPELILERILAKFSGEIVELVEEEEPAEPSEKEAAKE
ncbi:MAG: hypothetical protein AAF555_03185 [Verrucomicrobiota bacterium]